MRQSDFEPQGTPPAISRLHVSSILGVSPLNTKLKQVVAGDQRFLASIFFARQQGSILPSLVGEHVTDAYFRFLKKNIIGG
jgi:hypothetical protein